MAPVSIFFQAGFSAVLAAALFMSASLARAETITLVCQDSTTNGLSFTLRVDYDRKIVDMPNSADLRHAVGTAFLHAPATVTEGDVRWEVGTGTNSREPFFSGSLNRLSGEAYVLSSMANGLPQRFSGPCRRATQKF